MTPVIAKNFNQAQRATISISMTCKEWDTVGAKLAGIKGVAFQTTADAILAGLIKVGYFTVVS